jgi:hypothetical protein
VALASVTEMKVETFHTKVMNSIWCLHRWQCCYCGDGVILRMACVGPPRLPWSLGTARVQLTEFLHSNFACWAALPYSHFSESLHFDHVREISVCASLNFLIVPCRSCKLNLGKSRTLCKYKYMPYTHSDKLCDESK